ncbi:MAG: VPS10 domain-containing protein [Longimicrobiales bacterium]
MSGVRLFVGTKRGLFVLTSEAAREQWHVSQPMLAGREVYFVGRDGTDGTIWATTRHTVWGAHVFVSHDSGTTWDVLPSAPHYADGRGLHAVWCITRAAQSGTLFAGIEPAGLFCSRDGGSSWQSIPALNEHPTAQTWQPAGEALALHSIHIHGDRIVCAISAGGFYRSDDGGSTWRALNRGVRADFLPERYPASGQCVHKLVVHPANPDRIYQQNHCGVYRSDDGGENWLEITNELPSDYGYALTVDPRDPDTAFVIPEESSEMRTTVGGRVRVYRTTDAGSSWQPLGRGLPQQDAYLSILREGMDSDTLDPVGEYFGTSGGQLFASRNRGESWRQIAAYLPRIICVRADTIAQ